MKPSKVRFAQLQTFLAELGFSAHGDEAGWRFEQPASDTVFLFRFYRPSDRVFEHDLFLVRSQLKARGLMSDEVFDEALTKTPA